MAECDRAEYERSSAREGGEGCPRRQERRGGDSRTRRNSPCRREGQRGRWVLAYRTERSKETREQKPDSKTRSSPPLPAVSQIYRPSQAGVRPQPASVVLPFHLSFSHLNTEEGVKPAHGISPVLAQSLWRLHTPTTPSSRVSSAGLAALQPHAAHQPIPPGGPSWPLRFSWGSRHSCPVCPSSSSPPERFSLVTWDWVGIIPDKNMPRNPSCQQCLVPRSQRCSLDRSGS